VLRDEPIFPYNVRWLSRRFKLHSFVEDLDVALVSPKVVSLLSLKRNKGCIRTHQILLFNVLEQGLEPLVVCIQIVVVMRVQGLSPLFKQLNDLSVVKCKVNLSNSVQLTPPL